ncbi:MAG: HIT family protein [Chloroflexota bacterium]|nr:HIT family protein [Chloroflexota bacterium]
MDCIFCAIAAGRAPAEVVFEDEETMAFMDIHPANPGHTLVVPKRHISNIYKLDEETAAAVMRTTVRVARAIRAALEPDGMNLLQANGRTAGQSVFHFHVHIVPRWHGDGLRLARPPQVRRTAAVKETAARIRAHLIPRSVR